ncbi:MAG: GAF domain-containing protein [Cytophagaceae bacterium]|nr:MAG: GAF domain-containing protein [Cytophagaceae bacterium]
MQPIANLSNCDQEPVQWPGFIQSYGYLLALHPGTFEVWQASENVVELTQRPLNELIGLSVSELLLGDLPGIVVQELLIVATRNGNPEAFTPYQVTIYGDNWLVLLHRHDGALILELEPAAKPTTLIQVSMQTLLSLTITDIQRSTTLTELLAKTAVNVKAVTGFDRVMVYRFGEDWHGEVIAEAREDFLEPFLGLHYPASDIPKQARELYKINLVRGIVDVQQPRVGIYPTTYLTHNRPLDLTHAHLRAVSPLHIEYLQNMGVRSSMSISLLDRGELWGLIACHHYTGPRFIDYPARQSIKLVSQLLSTTLEIRHHDELAGVSEQLLKDEQLIYQQMMADWDVVQGLTRHRVTMLDLTSDQNT